MEGLTESEKYLNDLAKKAFLRPWAYANLYTDKNELADLIVYIKPYCLIFSVKDIQWKDKGDLMTSWQKWYKEAVDASIKQLQGATSALKKEKGQNLFFDRKNTQVCDLKIPQDSIFIRIAVAFGAEQALKDHVFTATDIKENTITSFCYSLSKELSLPFCVGGETDKHGYIHLMNKASLDFLLNELNTFGDLVNYLLEKEENFRTSKITFATGEEDLLAYYFQNFDENKNKYRLSPSKMNIKHQTKGSKNPKKERRKIKLQNLYLVDSWSRFKNDRQYIAKKVQDKRGLWIDVIMERLYEPIMGEIKIDSNSLIPYNQDRESFRLGLEFLAKLQRVERNLLAENLLDVTKDICLKESGSKKHRLLFPKDKNSSAFVLLATTRVENTTYEEDRQSRQERLRASMNHFKYKNPTLTHVTGIATESYFQIKETNLRGDSFDLLYKDYSNSTSEDLKEFKKDSDSLMSANYQSSISFSSMNDFPEIG